MVCTLRAVLAVGLANLLYQAVIDVNPHHLVCARKTGEADKWPHHGMRACTPECQEARRMIEQRGGSSWLI